MNVALAIEALVPAAQYGGSTTRNTEYSFDKLRWEDVRKKPTWKEVQAAWTTLEPTLPNPEEERVLAAEIERWNRAGARERLGLTAEGG